MAGFHVTGVDREPQPRYCGDAFIRADAVMVPLDGFEYIWASPPCQRYSTGAAKWGTSDNHPHLIPVIRERLLASGAAYTIENVMPARPHLLNPIMLCGTQFNLGVFRHRLFESSFLVAPQHHRKHQGKIGDGRYQTVTGHAGGSSRRDGWKAGGVAEWKAAMGIDWMTGDELAEAIPPHFAHYVATHAKREDSDARI
jgi:DNA (cytosine-5)-methyltransferase 1